MNKKVYSKPHISFENFEITTRVAVACSDAWMDLASSQWGLFNGPADGCDVTYDPADGVPGYEGICYHTIDVIYGS